jgi:uncharacterized protein YybS (DUF2232 family)
MRIMVMMSTQNSLVMYATHVKHLEEDFHQLLAPFPSLVILLVTLVALQACALLCPS